MGAGAGAWCASAEATQGSREEVAQAALERCTSSQERIGARTSAGLVERSARAGCSHEWIVLGCIAAVMISMTSGIGELSIWHHDEAAACWLSLARWRHWLWAVDGAYGTPSGCVDGYNTVVVLAWLR